MQSKNYMSLSIVALGALFFAHAMNQEDRQIAFVSEYLAAEAIEQIAEDSKPLAKAESSKEVIHKVFDEKISKLLGIEAIDYQKDFEQARTGKTSTALKKDDYEKALIKKEKQAKHPQVVNSEYQSLVKRLQQLEKAEKFQMAKEQEAEKQKRKLEAQALKQKIAKEEALRPKVQNQVKRELKKEKIVSDKDYRFDYDLELYTDVEALPTAADESIEDVELEESESFEPTEYIQ